MTLCAFAFYPFRAVGDGALCRDRLRTMVVMPASPIPRLPFEGG